MSWQQVRSGPAFFPPRFPLRFDALSSSSGVVTLIERGTSIGIGVEGVECHGADGRHGRRSADRRTCSHGSTEHEKKPSRPRNGNQGCFGATETVVASVRVRENCSARSRTPYNPGCTLDSDTVPLERTVTMQWPNTELARTPGRKLRLGRRQFRSNAISASADPGSDRDLLAESLWNSLPFSRREEISTADRGDLVTAYLASHAKLARAGAEIDRLFFAVARASLEIRDCGLVAGEKRRAEYRRKLSEIRQSLSFEFSPDASLPQNSLLVDVPELVEFRIEKRLRADIEQLVDTIFEKLDELAGENVLGNIDWDDERRCTFQYFGHVLIRNAPTLSARTERTITRQGFTEVTREDKLTVARQTTTYRAVRHQHRLENAKLESLADCSMVLPAGITEIIDAIPPWLKPVMQIVVGDCVHERIIEHDIGESVDEEIVHRESVRTERYIDPAIVLGSYVLTGWGDREIRIAEDSEARAFTVASKQTELSDVEAASNSHRNIGLVAILGGLAVFAAGISSSIILPAVGIAVAIGGVLLLSYSIYLRSTAAIPAVRFRDIFTFGARVGFAVGALFSAVAAIQQGGVLPLGMMVMFGIAFFSTRRFASE